MWKVYAILSAVFAALTAIFAKIGIVGIDSNLATAIRTCIIMVLTWGIVFFTCGISGIATLTKTNWLFLLLSGVATGLSWLCYFKAIQIGEVSKVAPIDKLSVVLTIGFSFLILKEPMSWKVLSGAALIACGSLVILSD